MSKRYFVFSDVHSYCSLLKQALLDKGFDINNNEHILVSCGDLFDRGSEPKELIEFLNSVPEERRILIRGNHEDLFINCLNELKNNEEIDISDYKNGVIGTIANLCGITEYDILIKAYNIDIFSKCDECLKLINTEVDYAEVGDVVFVHGWIPEVYVHEDLCKCTDDEWRCARWSNGMWNWHNGNNLEGKTIVCGHWNTSFGNFRYHNSGDGEFTSDSDFSPFIDDGIIALDACTHFSKKINVIVLNDKGEIEDE